MQLNLEGISTLHAKHGFVGPGLVDLVFPKLPLCIVQLDLQFLEPAVTGPYYADLLTRVRSLTCIHTAK